MLVSVLNISFIVILEYGYQSVVQYVAIIVEVQCFKNAKIIMKKAHISKAKLCSLITLY